MEPAAPAGGADHGERDGQTWLAVLTDAVEVLLRQAERHLDAEVQAAFTAGQASTVRLRQLERDQARTLRERLRSLRTAQAAEDGR